MTALAYGLALVIGFSLGLLGGGGSILTVPVLVYALAVPVKVAVPMSLFVVGTTSLVGALSHQGSSNIRWDAALAFGPAAIVGAFAGGRLGLVVSASFQLALFASLMLAAAVPMYRGSRPVPPGPASDPPRRNRVFMVLLGFAVGVLTGLVGIGGGFLYVPALVLVGRLPMSQAVGTSLVLIVLSSVAGFASYLGQVSIPWTATAIFTGLAMVGVLVGSRLVSRVPQVALRRGFAVLLVLMGVLVLSTPRP